MEPDGISAAVEEVRRETVAEAVEAISPLGNILIFCKQFSSDIRYALFQQSLSTGVPPLGVSTSRGPTDLPEGIRGEASTSAGGHYRVGCLISRPALLSASVGEMSVVSLTLPILTTAGLKIITSPMSPTLAVEPVLPEIVTSPTSIVAGVLVSTRTP